MNKGHQCINLLVGAISMLCVFTASAAVDPAHSDRKDFSNATLIFAQERIESINIQRGLQALSNQDCGGSTGKKCSEEEEERTIIGRKTAERWWRDDDGDWYEEKEFVRYNDSREGEWQKLSDAEYRKGSSGYKEPPEHP